MSELTDLLQFAVETAKAAGHITLRHFGGALTPERKADDSPVTIADRDAERAIRAAISDRFPHHAVLGEEYGNAAAASGYRWIIDPIDGTRAFVRGVPLFAVLLALEIEGEVVVGVAHFPALDETISAARGLGCHWGERPARVSSTSDLQRALVAHADTASFARLGRGDAWARLQAATEFRAGWGDAYGYLLVATGRADVMLDPIMNIWDCGPFGIILPEAGGYFGDWSGRRTIDGGEALACNEALLPEVLRALNGA